MQLDWAMVGMLALPKGPELLERKQQGERVLDNTNSDLPPSRSHWLLALSALCPLGYPSSRWTP